MYVVYVVDAEMIDLSMLLMLRKLCLGRQLDKIITSTQFQKL